MNIIPLIKKDFKMFFKSRSAVALTYLVPMVITLIFGAVFGGFGKTGGINEIKVILVDEDRTEFSKKFTAILDSLQELAVHTKRKKNDEYIPFDQNSMDEWIREGKRKLGIYIPKGFEKSILTGRKIPLEIHFDPKYQIEYGITNGIINKVLMENFPQILLKNIMKSPFFRQFSSAEARDPILDNKSQNFGKMDNPVDLKSVKLLGKAKENSMFAQYVAGMAVMFLLFSVTHAGASLIDEKNNGTINRLLIAPVRRSEILVSKMFYISLMGLSQLIVLFIFGWLVFSLNIFKDVSALVVMIIVTALACASVGIFIASICKNQQQVGSLSTLIVLGMSALGGSMFPSFIMPRYIQTIGKFTLNHWAMKGITDIFWYSKHLADIFPSVLILLGITVMFSFIAIRIFNKRLLE
ncbi:MAG TPA: ABC transporter permease [Candidatus Cloacimonetes bacterium]|nr:ABC transporter permease [Candidatus Cloacimonadota bacterium]